MHHQEYGMIRYKVKCLNLDINHAAHLQIHLRSAASDKGDSLPFGFILPL